MLVVFGNCVSVCARLAGIFTITLQAHANVAVHTLSKVQTSCLCPTTYIELSWDSRTMVYYDRHTLRQDM